MRLPSDGDRTGRTLGAEEVDLLREVVLSGTLNSTRGSHVHAFEQAFTDWLGGGYGVACSSGTAAVHCCIQALRMKAGDEVITTPVTDMGALTPILYEGGVPVFADVDPRSLNVTAATLEAQITDRTRGIIVTHLFGLPCDMAEIMALAERHGLPIIEDCAQAFGATIGDQKVGTFGDYAAFSLQQGKHVTTGEGGIALAREQANRRPLFLAVNKAWGYGDERPDHYFPALNYRMTELQGAVANAQLRKLDGVVAARQKVAAGLAAALGCVPGLDLPTDPENGRHVWWKFAFCVDPEQIDGGAVGLGLRMRAADVACAPRYVQKPAFECALFQDWSRHPVTSMPLQNNPRAKGPQPPFARADYPGAIQGLEQILVLPVNELYTDEHVAFVAGVIREAAEALSTGARTR